MRPTALWFPTGPGTPAQVIGSTPPPPGAPVGLSTTSGPRRISLTWKATGGATRYSVSRSSSPSGPFVLIASGLTKPSFVDRGIPVETVGPLGPRTADRTYADSGLPEGSTWYSTVSVENRGGLSPPSSPVAGYTRPGPPVPPLIAHCAFDETSGQTAADSSGNQQTATFASTPTWSAGKVGHAIGLTGTGGMGSVPHSSQFAERSQFTVAFWVNPKNFDGNRRYLLHKATGSTVAFSVFSSPYRQLYIDLDGSEDRFSTATAFANDTWYHVAVTFDGLEPDPSERVRVYVNGMLDRIATETDATLPEVTTALSIGQNSPTATNSRFNGQLDDLRLYRGRVPEWKIKQLATAP